MRPEGIEALTRITIEANRSLYQEPEILAHFSNPDRNADHPCFCQWELSLLREHAPEGGHILVVGCAGGQEAFAFVEAGYRVTGIDIVPEFIAAAREHAEKKGCPDRARFEVVDGFTWPVKGCSCDVVSMMSSFLYHLPARRLRKKVFSECYRVLTPGGVVMMDAPDRTHPGRNRKKEPWQPECPEDLDRKTAWSLREELGVRVDRSHVCRGDAQAQTLHPSYAADPRELWTEVEACGLRVIRLQCSQDPQDWWPSVTLVAVKD